ncbi:uncharacterized protein LOC126653571 isoform X2 [Mercurialis annua]|uniref:uncharacterized protein LOC126653571 isoform X2 n=1 Tax=Mercurialis annua TaxID=3986 RepID=UPI00215E8AD6|nr:uncharacterized protein LOC126653571 isoform X2 [Mercurialis annua]
MVRKLNISSSSLTLIPLLHFFLWFSANFLYYVPYSLLSSTPILVRGMNSSFSSGMADPHLIIENLPVGWRFHPTDEELLIHYLKPKILGDRITDSDIKEINISDYNPYDLFGQFSSNFSNKERYFVSPCEYYENSKLRKRKVRDGGFWKSTGDPREITIGDSEEVIGTKRSLVYHNPDATEMIMTEYAYTAQLDRPIMGNYVIYKLKRKPKKKKAGSKKSMKAETGSMKKPKNARKGESSICNSASASVSAFENKNLKDMTANSANGEGKESNHVASDLENPYSNKMIAISTYANGESNYPKTSDLDNQYLYKMTSASNSKQGEASNLMDSSLRNPNSNLLSTASASNSSERSCSTVFNLKTISAFKMADMLSYKKGKPSCQKAFCDENKTSCEITAVSPHNKDETHYLEEDFDFGKQNPIDISTNYLYNKDKTSCDGTLDFEIQNPIRNMDISASVEGNWSPLTEISSDFNTQNRYKKTDISFLEDNENPSMASKEEETTFQEVQSRFKMDMPVLEDYLGPLEASNAGKNNYEEVQSQCRNTDISDLEANQSVPIASDIEYNDFSAVDPRQWEEIMASLNSDLQQPTHSYESPYSSGYGMQMHQEKTDTPTFGDNQGPSADSDAGNSTTLVVENSILDDQQLEELFVFFELKDVVNSQQHPISAAESPIPNGCGASVSFDGFLHVPTWN